jgi:hypothetical protein
MFFIANRKGSNCQEERRISLKIIKSSKKCNEKE